MLDPVTAKPSSVLVCCVIVALLLAALVFASDRLRLATAVAVVRWSTGTITWLLLSRSSSSLNRIVSTLREMPQTRSPIGARRGRNVRSILPVDWAGFGAPSI
uniref:Putative secreted protein n=1 Tax=Anopheles darlingi TaxID=43151 RepID=A0A2M4DBL1_ANODA